MIKALLVLVVLALAGCGRQTPQKQEAEVANVSITHYSAGAELFVEFPPLVKGEAASFAAHLTRLSDFKPVTEGSAEIVLSGGQAPSEQATGQPSDSPGIFRIVITPQNAGKRRLSLRLSSAGLISVHELGELEVYADKAAAKAGAKPEKKEEGIAFSKEQQWRIPFASEPVQPRLVRESIPVNALVRSRPAGEAQVAAPGAGLLRAGPTGFPQLGMKVTAGQVLAYLVPRLGGENDAASLELARRKAQVELEHATRDRARLETLFAAEAVPEKRVLEARAREEVARAELRAAQQRLSGYSGGQNGVALKAPVGGTVVAVLTSPGAAVAEGQALIHIAELSRLWLEARVAESDIGRVSTPQGVFFRLDGDSQSTVLESGRNARLVTYGGMVDPETRTVPAIFEFANPAGRLRMGMRFRAWLYTGRASEGPAVPASALVDESGQAVVFVQKSGETFERRLVETGPRDGDWVALRAGIAPGERVVTRGAYQLRLAAIAPAALGHGHAH
jgi:membrane fusion protein, heavy metal efflux system